jgi:hypothetical protein
LKGYLQELTHHIDEGACFLLLKTARLATMANAPIGARKNPTKLRKFDPVRQVLVGGVSEPMR